MRDYKLSRKIKRYADSSSPKTRFQEILILERDKIRVLNEILRRFKSRYMMSYVQVLTLMDSADEYVPASIFASDLAPLEALVFYLKEMAGIGFAEASKMLNRDDRTLWITHRNASRKGIVPDISSKLLIPIKIFADRKFSILESLVAFLKEEVKLSNREISSLIMKNQKTVWTVYNRYRKKNE